MQAPGEVVRQRQFERSHCTIRVICMMDNITITYATVALRVPKSSKFNIEELMHFARVCRVENIIRPYVEAIL